MDHLEIKQEHEIQSGQKKCYPTLCAFVATWPVLCEWQDTPRSAVLRLEKKVQSLPYLLKQSTGPHGSENEQVHSQVGQGGSTTGSL